MPEQDADRMGPDLPVTPPLEEVTGQRPAQKAPAGIIAVMGLWMGHAFFAICAFAAWAALGLFTVVLTWAVSAGLGMKIRGLSSEAFGEVTGVAIVSGLSLFVMSMMAHWLHLLYKYDDEARLRVSMKHKIFGRQILTALCFAACLILPVVKSSFLVGVLATFTTCTVGVCYAFLGGALTWTIIRSIYTACVEHPFWGGVWTALSNLCVAVFMIGLFGLHECGGMLSEMNVSEYDSASIEDYLHNLDEGLESSRFHDCVDQLQTEVTIPETHRLENKKGINASDAEDIIQDVLVRVCTKHSRDGVDNVVPYFVQSVNHAASDYHTSMTRRAAFECQWTYIGRKIQDPYDPLFARIELERVLCRLDTQEQELLMMKRHGYNTADIARELDITPSNARKRLSRLYKKLRDAL